MLRENHNPIAQVSFGTRIVPQNSPEGRSRIRMRCSSHITSCCRRAEGPAGGRRAHPGLAGSWRGATHPAPGLRLPASHSPRQKFIIVTRYLSFFTCFFFFFFFICSAKYFKLSFAVVIYFLINSELLYRTVRAPVCVCLEGTAGEGAVQVYLSPGLRSCFPERMLYLLFYTKNAEGMRGFLLTTLCSSVVSPENYPEGPIFSQGTSTVSLPAHCFRTGRSPLH